MTSNSASPQKTTSSTRASRLRPVLVGALVVAAFTIALYSTQLLTQSEAAREFIASFGYLGVGFLAIVAGLNAVVPVPAATLTPLFIAAGLSVLGIIVALTLGTLIADLTGYLLGWAGRDIVREKYPRTYHFFTTLQEERRHFVPPTAFLYASFVPFPNEALVIPLALSGVPVRTLLLPLLLGNIVHQSLLVYGVTNVVTFLF